MSAAPRGVLPRAFQSLRALRSLNVASVGLALSAVTAVVVAHVFSRLANGDTSVLRSLGGFGGFGIYVGLPTLLIGVLWAGVLRLRATVLRTSLRWGWVASIPLAMLNAGIACGLLALKAGDAGNGVEQLVFGAIAGATLGAILWIPALVATLVCFGVPIAWSQSLATRGLAGEERGEMLIGAASALVALLGVLLLFGGRGGLLPDEVMLEWFGYRLMWLCALGGAATGMAAAILAQQREARRKHFVKEVEAGQVAGLRVDATSEGKVLVRHHFDGPRLSRRELRGSARRAR